MTSRSRTHDLVSSREKSWLDTKAKQMTLTEEATNADGHVFQLAEACNGKSFPSEQSRASSHEVAAWKIEITNMRFDLGQALSTN